MKKTFKKLDNIVVKALTNACETAKDWDCGFEWLTHTADYDNFPASLMITCVFSLDEETERIVTDGTEIKLYQLIKTELLNAGIKVKDVARQVRLDSEERCLREDNGDWNVRINRRYH